MKEQPIETREHVIGHSIGQRPIHTSYEPPGPMPQFRPRPKVSPAPPQPQSVPKRLPKRGIDCESSAEGCTRGICEKRNHADAEKKLT